MRSNQSKEQQHAIDSREAYSPGPAAGARIHNDDGRWTLIIVRQLHHPPEKVWRALTDPVHLREWAPFDADGSLATPGATVRLSTVAAPTPMISETRVTRAEEPRILEYNWGEKELRWELDESDGGTRLTLWHNIDRDFIAMGAAGWHICLDVLDRSLSGIAIGRIVGGDAMNFEWGRLKREYERQFGIQSRERPAESP